MVAGRGLAALKAQRSTLQLNVVIAQKFRTGYGLVRVFARRTKKLLTKKGEEMKGLVWRLPESVPRDRTFIADLGYPWAVIATYSPAMDQLAVADLEASVCDGKSDLYFCTEWHDLSELKGWMDLPGVAMAKIEGSES